MFRESRKRTEIGLALRRTSWNRRTLSARKQPRPAERRRKEPRRRGSWTKRILRGNAVWRSETCRNFYFLKKSHKCFVSVLDFSYSFVSSRFFMQEAAQRREQKKIEKKQMKMKQIKVKAMWKRKSIQAHGESVLCSAFLPATAIQLPQFQPEIFHQTL